jgi:hypothetical protein
MRLTLESDPESVKRYGHLKPVRGFGARPCSTRFPGSGRACTLARGHGGPHVAHGRLGKVLAVWDAAADVVPTRAARPAPGSTGNVREDSRAVAILDRVRAVVAYVDVSVEGILLLVLFLAMVGFVIDWLFMIVG